MADNAVPGRKLREKCPNRLTCGRCRAAQQSFHATKTHAGTASPIWRSIDVHASRISQKIEPNINDPILIKTVLLGGYLFTPKVEDA